MDIHNTLEILEAVEILALAGAKIAKDKKVNLEDLPVLVDIAKKFDKLSEAITDVDQIYSEIKDLDESELIAIVSKVLIISKSLKAELL